VELTNDLKQIEAIRREVGMVFQHFNLFPHLTAGELHAGADVGAQDAQAQGRGNRHALPGAVRIPEQATSIRASCPAASSSAWRSPARCA
jgi:ABC-type polar amino acid transport system ATPase subunit